MSAHTPTPWHYLDIGEIVPSDADGLPHYALRICFMATPGNDTNAQDRIDANAELIVRAVNSHEDMLGALRHLRAFWRPGSDHDTQEVQQALAAADAALAKATGK